MKNIFILIFVFYYFQSYGCLNLYGTNINGKHQEIDRIMDIIKSPTDYPTQEKINSEIDRIIALDKLTQNDYTDLAAYYVYNGEHQKAVNLLNKNISNKLNNYSFCSNIGVAYELLGNLDSALYWTKRGVKINPESHYNSEWIHVKILEVEILMKKNKNWLNNNSIFGFYVPMDSNFTEFPDSLDYSFFSSLQYQLNERTFFVKPHHQNKLVAKLLLILADFVAVKYDTYECKQVYKLSAEYDTTIVNTINLRLNALKNIEKKLGIEHYKFSDKDGLTITNDNKKNKRKTLKLTQKRASYRVWNIIIVALILITAIVLLVRYKNKLK